MSAAEGTAHPRNLGKGKIAQIVGVLGERIARGDFPSDRPLPVEPELAARLSVGRSVLREAMKVLASKGMVSARPRHGTVITPRSEWNLFDVDVLHWVLRPSAVDPKLVRDILVVRRIIEPDAARLAAENATMADNAAILAAVASMRAAIGDPHASVRADIAFHTAVLKASQNAILLAFCPALRAILYAFFQISIEKPDLFTDNLPAHERVAQAIAREDPAAAEAAMLEVLSVTENDVSQRLSLRPDTNGGTP